MTIAFGKEWFEKQIALAQQDKTFQDECEGLDRSFACHVLADPDNGVAEDYWWGFYAPPMEPHFWGAENVPETDYVLEGDYGIWHQINEGRKGLVASLLDETLLLRKGSTPHLAMFVAAVERFFELSREITTGYHGRYETTA